MLPGRLQVKVDHNDREIRGRNGKSPVVGVRGRELVDEPESRTVSDSDPTRALTGSTDPVDDRPDGRDRSGLLLGRYQLEAAIGSGGHGSVWRAFDAKLERPVAVKVLTRSSAAHDRRAEREARAAARLNHPGIVALYELGEDADAIYLVSELVDGRTLAELEADGLVSDRDLGEIGVALCDALAHAHRKQVVHRDVKPQNVLVVADPAAGAGFVKLTDFGVARLLSEEPLTVTGGVVGTVAYMAPEQAGGQSTDEAADVYSLALTLHEGWSGVRPGGPTAAHRPLTQLRRDLPPALASVIDLCLVGDPGRRPGLDELRMTLEEGVDDLADEGGLIAPGPLERIGLTIPLRPRANVPGLPSAPRGGTLAARVGAAVLAAVIVAAAVVWLAPGTPEFPLAAAAATALACVLVPRLGWLAAAAGLLIWLAADGRTGIAFVLALALAAVPPLLWRAGALWSVPLLAGALGLAGLGGAFVGIAACAASGWRRVGLAVSGFAWLIAVQLVAGDPLNGGVVRIDFGPESWGGSPIDAARDAIYPALITGLPAFAGVWAAAALLAPLVIRGGRPVMLGLGAIAWTAAWAIAVWATADALMLPTPRDLIVSAGLAAGVAALGIGLRRARAERFAAPDVP